MTKHEFLTELSNQLQNIPDSKKAIAYYSEMIDDRMEEGMSEEDAVRSLDSIKSIRDRIISETPLPAFIEAHTSKPLSTVTIILLIFGFPLWFPLLITFGVLLLSAYIVVASLLFSIYAIVFSFAIGGVVEIVTSIFLLGTNVPSSIFNLGLGLIMIALSILLFHPANIASRSLLNVTKWSITKIKSLFIQKGGAS